MKDNLRLSYSSVLISGWIFYPGANHKFPDMIEKSVFAPTGNIVNIDISLFLYLYLYMIITGLLWHVVKISAPSGNIVNTDILFRGLAGMWRKYVLYIQQSVWVINGKHNLVFRKNAGIHNRSWLIADILEIIHD